MFKYISQVGAKDRKKKKKQSPLYFTKNMNQTDISLYPSMFIGNSTCQGISSSSITVTGNWQEVYVYGYYQTVLEAKISTFELDMTNTSILYEP
jgi:hypothetical protein